MNEQGLPSRLRDPRRERIARLLRERIGGNAEDFYRDGCAIVEDRVVLQAGSHMLGHCAREIESAVREVMVALLVQASDLKVLREQADKRKDTQRTEVEEIVRRLGLEAAAPELELWMQLADRRGNETTKGLHSIAHRHAHRHAPPIDEEFRELWRRFEALLVVLLRELEVRFTDLLPQVRELAKRATPGETSVKRLNELPNTYVLRSEFYELATPGWLPKLDEAGYFDDVPRPIVDSETGDTFTQQWPAIDYLARLLRLAPHQDAVLTILERITIPHEFAQVDLLKVGATLDGEARRRYARHLVKWIRAQQRLFIIAVQAADLATALARDGDHAEAAAILEELLSLRPDPRTGADGEEQLALTPTPQTRVDEHDYEVVVERGLQRLAELAPLQALGVALPLLKKALEFSTRPGLAAEHTDLSPLWMPELKSGSTRYGHRPVVLIAEVVRESALAAMAQDLGRIDSIIGALDGAHWTLCRRIALQILDESGDVSRIRTRLVDAAAFSRDRFLREFAELAAHQLGSLNEADRRVFVALIEAQTPLARYAGGEPIEPEEAKDAHEGWKVDLLRSIANDLPADLRDYYAEALKPRQAPASREPERIQVPPLTASELAALDTSSLVSHLKSWQPPPDPFGETPIESQAAALREAVIADAPRFTAAAMKFAGLDPTYVRAIFTALRDLIDKHQVEGIAWDPVFDLAEAAIAHPVAENEGMGFGRDPGWGWTRKEIADVLRVALSSRPRHLPFAQRERVRVVIHLLAEDPRAAQLGDAEEEHDALSASINTTRGSALHAAIEYVFWVTDETGGGTHALQLVPEMRSLLESHLDPDSDKSIAARGAYGFYLPQLLRYDEEWTIAHRELFFPHAPAAAAELTWQAYVAWHHIPPLRALDLFVDEYRAAIAQISPAEIDRRVWVNVDEAIAQHLAHALIRGWIGVDSADGLLRGFYDRAPARLRGYLIEFTGRILRDSGAALRPEHCERVQALWEFRLSAARESPRPERRAELEAFGAWFVSGQCDREWMLAQLLATVELTGSIEPDSLVMEKLVEIAQASPVEATTAVDLLTEAPKERWFVHMTIDEIQQILRIALVDARSHDTAQKLVNRLVADGYRGLGSLLEDPPPTT
jgi:hypothetical protein